MFWCALVFTQLENGFMEQIYKKINFSKISDYLVHYTRVSFYLLKRKYNNNNDKSR